MPGIDGKQLSLNERRKIIRKQRAFKYRLIAGKAGSVYDPFKNGSTDTFSGSSWC